MGFRPPVCSTGGRVQHRHLDCLPVRHRGRRVPGRTCPPLKEAAGTAPTKAFVLLDGTLLPIDRIAADRPFCSGKPNKHGMNVQGPGQSHLPERRPLGPTGIDRRLLQELTLTEETVNRVLAEARVSVERGVAPLESWRIFLRSLCSPNRITSTVRRSPPWSRNVQKLLKGSLCTAGGCLPAVLRRQAGSPLDIGSEMNLGFGRSAVQLPQRSVVDPSASPRKLSGRR